MAATKKTTTWIAAATLGILVALGALMASLITGDDNKNETSAAIVMKDEAAGQDAIVVEAPASQSPSPSPSPSASPSPSPSPTPTEPPLAATAGSAQVGKEANVWGLLRSESPSQVWVEVQLPDGSWSKSQEGMSDDKGAYVLPLTYGADTPGTYQFRVGMPVPGAAPLYSEIVSLTREAPPAPAPAKKAANSGNKSSSGSGGSTSSKTSTAKKSTPKTSSAKSGTSTKSGTTKTEPKPAAKPAPKPAPKYYDDDDDDDDDYEEDDDDDDDDD